MLANANLDKDLAVLAKYGRVVVVGNRGRIEIDPRQTMARDADIRGMTLMNADDDDLRGIHAGLLAGLENGTLRPVIRTEMPLADAAKAHEKVLEPGRTGRSCWFRESVEPQSAEDAEANRSHDERAVNRDPRHARERNSVVHPRPSRYAAAAISARLRSRRTKFHS